MENKILKVENLNEKAYDLIKRAILHNELLPGTRIVDSQLADMLGISRTPVRDAIQLLTKEGLIEIKDKKGYYVFSASPKDINEIFDIRLMLDKEVLHKIITVLLPTDYEHYITEINKIDPGTVIKDKNNGIDFVKSDELFHDSIIALYGNSRFTTMYTDNRNQMKVFRQLTSNNDQRIERVIENHKSLLSAIKAMNFEQTVKITVEHIEVCRKETLEDFGYDNIDFI